MSRIDELIQKHCPMGVQFKLLGQVAGYSETRVDAKSLHEESFVGVDNLLSNQGGKVAASYKPNTVRLTAYEKDDILLGNIRPYLKKIWLATNDGGCSGDVLAIRISGQYKPQLDPGFLYRLLSSEGFFAYNMQHAKGAKMPRGSKTAILKYRVPVPPIEVQREIVRILDAFSKLEAELEAELEARRKQYTFYRDTLVQNDAFPRHSMGSIGEFIRGKRFTKKDIVGVGIPAIHYGDIYTHYGVAADSTISHVRLEMSGQLRYANPGDVVIATVGETVEDVAKAVAWLGREQVAIHDDTFLFRSKQNPKYISYAMQTAAFHAQKRKHVARGKVKRTSGSGLGKVAIPVPELHEQERIVGILDKFDALVNDLSAGLPAELRARRQQYEHYRDRLLNFKDNPNAHAGSSSQEGNPPWEWSGNPLEERIGPGFPPAEGIANGSRSDSPPSGSPPSGSPPLEGWQAKPDGVVP